MPKFMDNVLRPYAGLAYNICKAVTIFCGELSSIGNFPLSLLMD